MDWNPASEWSARASAEAFYEVEGRDLFSKCSAFAAHLRHAAPLHSELLSSISEPIEFERVSFLGLDRHPRVVAAAQAALKRSGCGTARRGLCQRELEETLADFHGREDAMLFSSGFTANLGAITGLVRRTDLVVRDRFSHASVHEGSRASRARFPAIYDNRDCEGLDAILARHASLADCRGKLVVTDSVFEANGRLAPLPRLVELARRHGARLMLFEAHGTGVLGPQGRGIEDQHQLRGAADLITGSLHSALGIAGGYLVGDRAVVEYLRVYARPARFSSELSAAACAAATEALRAAIAEPEHRARLWANRLSLDRALRGAGFDLPAPESPILSIPIGNDRLTGLLARKLLQLGIRVRALVHPAAPQGEGSLRLRVSASHTPLEIETAASILGRLGRTQGLLQREAPPRSAERAAEEHAPEPSLLKP